ncbi:WYL domain-containing protein [Umezawaea sp. Da 62-37]|uniref:helix-turn-helix transcriptional regulator n=1 Tax=Umezawaea sp. Da 62-37 TaxID=3075927 RepID=UPI0028F72455|nr:WYL domain-containing protein [Umezawaea sp. Da 62-37]WNV86636.1 WYL domain-containing protein [Umezawaea sp. Da 62-37]
MRADRLVATLLLMQAHGRVTAAELATELEVSVATARRDLEALSTAGVPVYPQPGRGGGWSLVGGARTDLSGLTASEAQALFVLAGPAAAVSPAVKSALRKLVRALPETFRADAEAAARAVVVDPTGWGGGGSGWGRPEEVVERLKTAVVRRVRVRFGYPSRGKNTTTQEMPSQETTTPEVTTREATTPEVATPEVATREMTAWEMTAWEVTTREVDPWGLVEKGGVWYLVAGTDSGQRTFRVDRMVDAVVLDTPARRPDDFELTQAWERVVGEMEGRRSSVTAVVTLPAALLPVLRSQFGRHCEVLEHTDGRVRVRVAAHTALGVAQPLAGWGALVEVEEPQSVRAELARLGAELVGRYA